MREWKHGLVISLLVAMITANSFNLTQSYAAPPAAGPEVGGCPVFPANNIWNTPINNLPVDPKSDAYVNSIGSDTNLHPDFGSGEYEGETIGIPYITVPAGQAKVQVSFDYDDESDLGPYPIPPNAPVEGGPNGDGDRHILVVERGACKLYELYAAEKQGNNSWQAGSGAIYDLNGNALRPAGWTSADAAGLPIFPGLVRYDEVKAGAINHALRFTVERTQNKYIWPARHRASDSSNSNLPPMGQRFRLKANFDLSGYPPDLKVILTALKNYGMFVADNGSDWFISGTSDDRWDNDLLNELKDVPGSAFEAVDESGLQSGPDTAQVKGTAPVTPPVSSDCQAFPETGFSACGKFLAYWKSHGGLAQQGLPISEVFEEQNQPPPAGDGKIHKVQYFERARFEEHLENQPPYDVLLGLLGSEQFKAKYSPPNKTPDSRPLGGACQTFPETNYATCGIFLDYWKSHGGLAQQGFPISEVFEERNSPPPAGDGKVHRVQYFQRARFEEHTEASQPYIVQLGLLGTEQYTAKKANGSGRANNLWVTNFLELVVRPRETS